MTRNEPTPLALRNKASKRFLSPMQTIASWVTTASMDRMEIIREFALPPWTSRVPVLGKDDFAEAAKAPSEVEGIIIATSSSVKNGMVGMGGVVHDTTINGSGRVLASYSVTLGSRDEQNSYTAELAAVAMALRCMPHQIPFRDVTVISSNLSVVAVIRRPRQQSGQCTVREMYDQIKRLQRRGCSVRLMWVPAKGADFALGAMAKAAAQRATKIDCIVETPSYQAKSTTLRLALAQRQPRGRLPESVGKYSKCIDTALPGKHTRALYDALKRKESDVLAQLRTGMARLNGHLHRIGAVESELCECGQATETIEHFLFRCKKWTTQREIMLQCSRTKIGNLSFFLGGKSAADNDKWQPDMQAVRAAIAFTLATKRLDADQRPATR
jgi:ribonuclease HI